MEIIETTARLTEAVADARRRGLRIGLVPTMGALHAGHISLVERARRECDFVIVSIFVNPTQFNNPDDLRTYPRTPAADCDLLRAAAVDVAFTPTAEEMYPEPDTRTFDLGPVAEVMEGAMRPGHFNGVAQIVSKLFALTRPHRAYFGEKDFQQIAVIRRMVALEGGFDGLEIVACPIRREADGLAMSSRNVRLSAGQRALAPRIHAILTGSVASRAAGKSPADTAAEVLARLSAVDGFKPEYYQIVDADTLQPLESWPEGREAVGCVTVWLGDVRLIDNIKYPA